MDPESILEQFRETSALMEGHFILSSGLHSPKYLQCALALQYPFDAAKYGAAIARRFIGEGVETVASPAIGGLVIGYEVAKALNVRFIWTERNQGEMTVRRGFTVKQNERILVVEDVITTGGSVLECINALRDLGGNVIGGASIIDRAGGKAVIGVPRMSLVEIDVPAYHAEACPMCEAGTEAVKPGSRGN